MNRSAPRTASIAWGPGAPGLRELEKVDLRNDSAEWQAFAKTLRRLLRDGMRLRKCPGFAPGKFQSRVDRLNARLAKLACLRAYSHRQAAEDHLDGDTRRRSKVEGKRSKVNRAASFSLRDRTKPLISFAAC